MSKEGTLESSFLFELENLLQSANFTLVVLIIISSRHY